MAPPLSGRILLLDVPEASGLSSVLRRRGLGVLVAARAEDARGLPFDAVVAGPDPAHRAWVSSLQVPVHTLVAAPPDPEAFADTVTASLRPAIEAFWLGPRHIDLVAMEVVLPEGAPIGLTTTEVALLRTLAAHAGQPVSRDTLLTEALGYAPGLASRAVDHAVGRLRGKLEADPAQPSHLTSVRGRGYRLAGLHRAGDAVAVRSPTSPLVGRDGLLRRLRDAWDARPTVLSLVGMAGMGKTAVLEAARAAVPGPPRCVDLEDAAGVDVPAGSLVAARAPLGIPGERSIVVGPLDERDARTLAAQRLGVDPDDTLVRDVVAITGGWPLAIELAAERLPVLGTDALVARLRRDPLRVLRSPTRQPRRHRDVRAILRGIRDPAVTALASRGEPVDWRDALGLVDEADLERLVERGIIASRDGRIALPRLLYVTPDA